MKHTLYLFLITGILALSGCSSRESAMTASGNAEVELYLGQSRDQETISWAVDKLREAGLDNKYDITRAFIITTLAAGDGPNYVVVPLSSRKRSPDGILQVDCLVRGPLAPGGRAEITELPDESGRNWYIRTSERRKYRAARIFEPAEQDIR